MGVGLEGVTLAGVDLTGVDLALTEEVAAMAAGLTGVGVGTTLVVEAVGGDRNGSDRFAIGKDLTTTAGVRVGLGEDSCGCCGVSFFTGGWDNL